MQPSVGRLCGGREQGTLYREEEEGRQAERRQIPGNSDFQHRHRQTVGELEKPTARPGQERREERVTKVEKRLWLTELGDPVERRFLCVCVMARNAAEDTVSAWKFIFQKERFIS